jgi:hypothetical protein
MSSFSHRRGREYTDTSDLPQVIAIRLRQQLINSVNPFTFTGATWYSSSLVSSSMAISFYPLLMRGNARRLPSLTVKMTYDR